MAQFFKKINKIWHLRKVYFRYSFHVMKRSRKCHCCKMSLQALNMTRCLLNKTTFLRRFHSIQPGYWSRVPTIWPSSDNQSLNHIEAYSFSSKICVWKEQKLTKRCRGWSIFQKKLPPIYDIKPTCRAISVTRFGKILKVLGNFFQGACSFFAKCWSKFCGFGQISITGNGQNTSQKHLVALGTNPRHKIFNLILKFVLYKRDKCWFKLIHLAQILLQSHFLYLLFIFISLTLSLLLCLSLFLSLYIAF